MTVIRKKFAEASRVNLRLRPQILDAVDAACRRRAGTISRNTWIAEAVAEKLARDDLARHETTKKAGRGAELL